MRKFLKGVTALLGVMGLSQVAEAQTLNMMKSLDAPHYDGQRTTWSPTSDIVNMFQDTLVATRLGRQDGHSLPRQVVDGQSGRQAVHVQAA
jgi:hypothetical protein